MRQGRCLLLTVALVILAFSLSEAGTRRPGARAPIGPAPGVAPRHGTTAPSITSASVAQPAGSLTPGSKPAALSSKPEPPHHLIGDPPPLASLVDVAAYNSLTTGTRRPGSKPRVLTSAPQTPRHLIGDPIVGGEYAEYGSPAIPSSFDREWFDPGAQKASTSPLAGETLLRGPTTLTFYAYWDTNQPSRLDSKTQWVRRDFARNGAWCRTVFSDTKGWQAYYTSSGTVDWVQQVPSGNINVFACWANTSINIRFTPVRTTSYDPKIQLHPHPYGLQGVTMAPYDKLSRKEYLDYMAEKVVTYGSEAGANAYIIRWQIQQGNELVEEYAMLDRSGAWLFAKEIGVNLPAHAMLESFEATKVLPASGPLLAVMTALSALEAVLHDFEWVKWNIKAESYLTNTAH